MDSVFGKKLMSSFKKPPRPTERKDRDIPPDLTEIDFHKRKRRGHEEDFDEFLTNDRKTIFDTKAQRETRNNLSYLMLSETKNKEESAKKIRDEIRSQYQKERTMLEESSENSRALDSVVPSIDSLIEADETYTNLSNKLSSDQTNSARRNPRYLCNPLLLHKEVEGIPDKIQDDIHNQIMDEDRSCINGIIPELNIAYMTKGKAF